MVVPHARRMMFPLSSLSLGHWGAYYVVGKKAISSIPCPWLRLRFRSFFFFALSQAASVYSRRTFFFSPRSKIYEFNYEFEGPPAKPANFV